MKHIERLIAGALIVSIPATLFAFVIYYPNIVQLIGMLSLPLVILFIIYSIGYGLCE